MRLSYILTLSSLMFTLYACQEVMEQLPGQKVEKREELNSRVYSGIDMDGNERQCRDMDDLFCTMVFSESDQYALDCQRDGNIAIQCSCHDWICVGEEEMFDSEEENLVTGYNIDGEVESCMPFDYKVDGQDVACSMEFTNEDQFAIDCQADGYETVQCGCHKFLCLE